MRSVEEQMKEINRRRTIYTEQKKIRRLTGLATVLGILLISAILYIPGVRGNVETVNLSYLGSTILGPEAGGYVIVALLAFALGVTVTLMIQKKKSMNTKEVGL